MAEFIEFLSPSALADLKKGNDELLLMIKNVDLIGQKMSKINTPSGSDSAIKSLTLEYQKQEKAIQSLQSKLEVASKKQQSELEKTRLAEIRLAQQREKAFDKYEIQLNKEQARLNQANGLYNQTQQKVNQLTKTYNDLAIKKELGVKLTTMEMTKLSKLTSELNIYQSALIKVDKDIQKNGRNVGNYASGWNGLSNSINQLSREAPAFANSVQTGFMALSNNLPILFDEITKVKNANKELIAQGQPIRSTFSQIAGAIFSWQTLLSVGVTVLTLYGAKIWDSISGSKQKKIALEAEKKALEDKIEAEKQQNTAIGQSIAQEQNRARILFEIARNTEVSDTKRKDALKELRLRYGAYLKDLTDEKILAGETAEQEERLNIALIGRGYALATQNLLEQNATAQMSAQVEYQKTLAKTYKDIQGLRNSDGSIKNEEKYSKVLRSSSLETQKASKVLNDKLKPLKEEESLLLSLFRENAKYLDVVNENTEKTKKNTKAKKENAEYATNSKKAFEENIKALETQLSQLDRFSASYDLVNGLLEMQKHLYDQLFGTVKQGQEEVIKGLELTEEQVYADYYAWLKLKDATNEYIKTLSSNAFNKAFNDIGLNSAKMFLDFDENGQSTFDKLIEGADKVSERFAITFQAVGDLSQDVFNKMVDLSNRRFDIERENLEKSKQIALLFAGDTTSAIQNIEEQYQEKQRAIRNREAQAKKKQAVFNILIDTAQGVVSALASTPPNVPLSIAIGVIGALQAGIVNAQEVPQFYKGTDNAPEGVAWTQEKGREIITDKSGKIKSLGSDKGAQLTYLNKGDKVFTAEKSAMMFNENLNNLLVNNGIDMPKIQINNQAITDAQINRIVDTIANKETANLNIDKSGLNFYVSNGHSIKERTNNRVTFKRQSV